MLYLQPFHLICTTFTRGHTSMNVYYTLYSFMLTYIKGSSNNGGEKLVKVSWATSLSHTQEWKYNSHAIHLTIIIQALFGTCSVNAMPLTHAK